MFKCSGAAHFLTKGVYRWQLNSGGPQNASLRERKEIAWASVNDRIGLDQWKASEVPLSQCEVRSAQYETITRISIPENPREYESK